MSNIVTKIIKKFHALLKSSDKLWIQRKRKINTYILFNIMSQVLKNNNGIRHTIAFNLLQENNFKYISDTALCKARKKCSYVIFDKIIKILVDKFTKKHHVYAVDGSKIHLPNIFSKENYTTRDKTSKRLLGMISCVYDVHNNIPNNILLTKHFNERKAAIEQFKSIKEDSILIFDRGYYSKNMLLQLKNHKLNYLFRLKKDANIKIKKFFLKNKTDKIITVNGIKLRIFKYSIKSQAYLCATNLFTQSINYLKTLYKLRWRVEEGFKIFKSYIGLKKIHSKTTPLLKQEISIRTLIFTLSRLIQKTIKPVKKNYNASIKLIIDIIIDMFINIFAIIDKFVVSLYSTQFKNIPDRDRI